MADGKTDTKGVSRDLLQYIESFQLSVDYCEPQWESYMRFYEFWRGKKPTALDSTISQIWVNIFHQVVQNRYPLIFQSVFDAPEYVTLSANSPEYQLSVDPAQTWIRDLLDNKIKIRNSAVPTVQSALIGGTGYRAPYVRYVNQGGKQVPIITSRDLNFFNVLPSPNGSLINPSEYNNDDAVDWMFVVDWWTEDYIRKIGGRPGFNKEQIGKLLDKRPDNERYEEDEYKDRFKTVCGLQYEGFSSTYDKIDNLPPSMKKRRIVHWYRRDKHIIVAEDAYVIYSGEPELGEGVIPVTKYATTPDMKGFFGISMIELVEDIVMAMIMNLNYRMDHLLGVMFPTTWIRDDIRRGKNEGDFIPQPYTTNFFPSSVSDIRQAIHYDRRPEVGQQTFIEEDRLKAMLQGVAGELETTGSYGDVVGNRSAMGVVTIANQLKARPFMEASILEETGFREEVSLLMKLGAKHVNEPVMINTPATDFATPWTEISPNDIMDVFSVQMHGVKYNMDENQRFQKTMALYPYWVNNPGVNQYELNNQVNDTADVLSEPEKVFIPPAPPAPEASNVRPSDLPTRPGGIASPLDIQQTGPGAGAQATAEAGTGEPVRAF